MNKLEKYREEIDKINFGIINLIDRRIKLVKTIKKYKKQKVNDNGYSRIYLKEVKIVGVRKTTKKQTSENEKIIKLSLKEFK